MAAKVAGSLRANGVEPGDRVAIILPNVPAFPVVFFGILLAGGIVVPMNPLLKAGEIDYFFTDSGAKVAFVWPDFVAEATKGAENAGTRSSSAARWARSRAPWRAATRSPSRHERADDDTAIMLYTSGTTGRPKGAELTHSNIHLNAHRSAVDIQEITHDDIVMGCLPLFHVFGLVVGLNAAVIAGASAGPDPAVRPRRGHQGDQRREGHDHAGRADDVCRDPQPPGLRRHGRHSAADLLLRRVGDAARGDEGVRGQVRLHHPRGLRPVRDLARRVVQHARPRAQARHHRRRDPRLRDEARRPRRQRGPAPARSARSRSAATTS